MIICLETLQGPFEDIILLVQIHKVVFIATTLPREVDLRYFLYYYFLMFLYFMRIIKWLHIILFTDVVGITLRVTSLTKPFHRISSFVESHFEIFWASFWDMLLYYRDLPCIFFYETLYRYFLRYSDSQCAKKVLQQTPLCWGHYAVFWGLFWVYSSIP